MKIEFFSFSFFNFERIVLYFMPCLCVCSVLCSVHVCALFYALFIYVCALRRGGFLSTLTRREKNDTESPKSNQI